MSREGGRSKESGSGEVPGVQLENSYLVRNQRPQGSQAPAKFYIGKGLRAATAGVERIVAIQDARTCSIPVSSQLSLDPIEGRSKREFWLRKEKEPWRRRTLRRFRSSENGSLHVTESPQGIDVPGLGLARALRCGFQLSGAPLAEEPGEVPDLAR
jgi:hypothetical protein